MKLNTFFTRALCAGILSLGLITSQAQPFTANWTGSGGDGLWNNAANWDIGVPGDGTNAVIASGNTVTYDVPMTAGDFGALTLNGVLNVNATGFISGSNGTAITVSGSSARLFVNNNGVMSATNGGITFTATAAGAVFPGGSLTVQGALRMGSSGSGNTGFMTNNGGTLVSSSASINPNNLSSSCLLLINGGSNSLGNVTIFRSSSGSASFNALGSEGLVISNGLVNLSSVVVGAQGANSSLTMQVAGGIVTNTGNFIVSQVSGANSRPARYIQHGGLVVSTISDGIRIGVSNSTQIAQFVVLGGTNIAEKYVLGDATNGATGVTVNFTNSANIYVGSGGIVTNNVNTFVISLNGGGLLGADADWSSLLPMTLVNGTFNFNAADLAGTAHNITLSARLNGGGVLNKIGGGTLTLGGANTFTGNTTVNGGTLALGASGSLSSPIILLGSGATFDVSAVTGGYTLPAGKTLAGFGSVTGTLAAASTAIINPGTNNANGTLTFSNSLTETGGAVNHFDLSTNPAGTSNDVMIVTGDLTVSGTNVIEITGTLSNQSIYKLIQYGGNFNGGITNFSLAGVTGLLTNDTSAKAISVIALGTIRPPTNVVWVGSSTANNWDTVVSTNWLNNGVLDYFVTGDNVRFDATGAARTNVNIVANESPGSVTVDSTANYIFSGGNITGTGGITKTNTGTLTILTTNSYSGPTVVANGTLEVVSMALSGIASSIGAASSDTNNLVFSGGNFRYLGVNATSDRGANLATNVTVDITNNSTVLTLSGTLAGSGELTKIGPGTLALTVANSYSGGTVISNGTLQLNSAGAAGSAGVTNVGKTLKLGAAFTLGNTIEFDGNCTVDLSNAGGDSALNGAWSGSGNVIAINQQNASRTFTVGGNGSGGGNLVGFSGTISMGTNAGFIRFNDGGGNPNLGSTSMTLDLGTSATMLARNGGITLNIGALTGGPGSKLSGRGSGSSGTLTYSIGGLNLSTTFAGVITNSANSTAITKVGTGTLALTGPASYTGATAINDGILQIDGTNSGSTITVSGGTLAGIGTIGGAVDVQANSALSPGDSGIGQMTINNSLTLESGSTNLMELNHNTGTNDNITGLTSITYGGTLVLTNLAGTLANGDKFILFTAGSYSGGFDTIIPDSPGAGLIWNTNNLWVDGSISVTPPVKPAFGSIIISGTDIILNTTNGSPGAQVIVLTTTNLLLPVSQWIPLTTNNFDAVTGAFSYTNSGALSSGLRQQFYIFQTQ